jgi:hypothetical protein
MKENLNKHVCLRSWEKSCGLSNQFVVAGSKTVAGVVVDEVTEGQGMVAQGLDYVRICRSGRRPRGVVRDLIGETADAADVSLAGFGHASSRLGPAFGPPGQRP